MSQSILRNHIMKNIELADTKATNLVKLYKKTNGYDNFSIELMELYFDVISPRVEGGDVEPFTAVSPSDIACENVVLKRIVEAKYAGINKMIELIREEYKTVREHINKR